MIAAVAGLVNTGVDEGRRRAQMSAQARAVQPAAATPAYEHTRHASRTMHARMFTHYNWATGCSEFISVAHTMFST